MSNSHKNNSGSRHGKRADGQTSATFTLSEELKAELIKLAKAEKRTLSNYMAFQAERIVAKDQSPYAGTVNDKAKAEIAGITHRQRGDESTDSDQSSVRSPATRKKSA